MIGDDARRKLKNNLKAVGLLEPLILNRTTGTLLGGHQRLACLDALEGNGNYLLDVSVVELTEKQEREQNIALNNISMQGDWDIAALGELLKTPDLDLSATGFEITDIALQFDDPELSALFQPNEATAALMGDVLALKADAAEQKKSEGKKGSKSGSSSAGDGGGDSDSDGDPGAELSDPHDDGEPEGEADRAKAFRKKGKELFNLHDDTETVACVIFRTREERENFVERLGYGRNERYVDGPKVVARLAENGS